MRLFFAPTEKNGFLSFRQFFYSEGVLAVSYFLLILEEL